MMMDQLNVFYKERSYKSIYSKWLVIQRSVLDFIVYVKTRGNRPSGFSSDLDWMKVLQASYVDLKNARNRAAGKRDKFCCPGLIDLHDFLIFTPCETQEEADDRRETLASAGCLVTKTP